MLLQYFGSIFLVFGLFQPLYWLYRPEIARCIFLGFGLNDGIGSLYVTREKQIWLFLAKKLFSVFGLFQAVVLAQSLRYCQVQNYGQWACIWCRQNRPGMQRLGRVSGTILKNWFCFWLFSRTNLALSPKYCQVQNFN